MHPYPGRYLSKSQENFNTRLSRAHRIVENAFGIMASQWRIYHLVIDANEDTANLIVKATVALHNFIRLNRTPYAGKPEEHNDQNHRFQFRELHHVGSNHSSDEALEIREKFSRYFMSTEGALCWQTHHEDQSDQ